MAFGQKMMTCLRRLAPLLRRTAQENYRHACMRRKVPCGGRHRTFEGLEMLDIQYVTGGKGARNPRSDQENNSHHFTVIVLLLRVVL
jgi:hypothetical protein